jgi:two-component system sensor histidine kinase HydH
VLYQRRILLQVTIPMVAVGLVFLCACVFGIWSINRLMKRAVLLSRNVQSLQAAQEMEVSLRQLRWHTLLYIMDPTKARRADIDQDDRHFQDAWSRAWKASQQTNAQAILNNIESSYQRYRAALEEHPTEVPVKHASIQDCLHWANTHQVRHLLDACEDLVKVNRENRAELTDESKVVSGQGRTALLLAGFLGPIGGIIGGFGVAWGLSRSITRLSVRLRDIHAELDQEVGSVRLDGADLTHLDKRLEHVLQRVRDVVARIQEQQQEVLRAEQLAAVGQLAASIAHEVRNPLTSIKLLVSAALRARPIQTLTEQDLRVIHDEVSRLERKVQTLLDFARPPESVRASADLRQIVQRSIDIVQTRIRQQGVQIEMALPDEAVSVHIDPDQCTSVLVNLFLNALDAMPRGGRLSVGLRAGPEGKCQLLVEDSGPGIDPAVMAKLFTPFASTKPTGTGLGLSICRRIVLDHGGTLSGANRSEGGAVFTITLPINGLAPQEKRHAETTGRR